MRCIEIILEKVLAIGTMWLTLTWDVLKFFLKIKSGKITMD